jgi:hypothetical protein
MMNTEAKDPKPVENEFARLGENLRKAVEEAWQSEERKRLSDDLQEGIKELGDALSRTANDFVDSPTGQRLRADVEEFSSRVQEGEVVDRVESELVSVLDRLNQKLEEVISSMASERDAESAGDEG